MKATPPDLNGSAPSRWRVGFSLLVLTSLPVLSADLFGTWRASVENPSGHEVAFDLKISPSAIMSTGAPSGAVPVSGDLVNGTDHVASSSGWMDGQTLTLRYDFYDATLTAKVSGDRLTGSFVRQWEKQKLTRKLGAVRKVSENPSAATTIDVTGEWVLKVGDSAKPRLWRAAFLTTNGWAGGTVIPVSGDWGSFAGTWTNEGELTLSRFDGINSRLLKLALQPDGTMTGFVDLGLFDPSRRVVAERMTEANRALADDLPDPNQHTRMRNTSEPFRFRFPDLDGNVVAWDDPRFKGKVVIVSVTGTWCPTCHEETPFLQELYARYQPKGLEVVALAFEYTGDAERDRKQVRIFAQRHGVTYPMLLAGSTDDAPEKLPQLDNFGAYPTAILIGRDGLVKRVHAGFEGKAAGERSVKLKAEMESFVRELLDGLEK